MNQCRGFALLLLSLLPGILLPGCVAFRAVAPAPSPTADMVWIPGGRAFLGSNHHYPEERTVHAVAVEGFWIDRHEVTNARFAAFVAATGYVTSAERAEENGRGTAGSMVFRPASEGGIGWRFVPGADWRHPEGPSSSIEGRENDPVVQVSRRDAQAFARWAGQALPTEAQWEFAARGGLGAPQDPWAAPQTAAGQPTANTWQGFFPLENRATDGYSGRAPVGSYPPDRRGLFDMIGNVWEWTRSTYYPTHQPPAVMRSERWGFDPQQGGAAVGVIKGGSYLCAPNACRRYRATARHPQDVELGTNHLGFRTVLQ